MDIKLTCDCGQKLQPEDMKHAKCPRCGVAVLRRPFRNYSVPQLGAVM